MWVYTEACFPNFWRTCWRRGPAQLVSIEGARVLVEHDGLKGVLVAEYPTGKRIGLFAGATQEVYQNFQFILHALESGYNYLDLVYVRNSLGPVHKPVPVGFIGPVPIWEPPAEAEDSTRNWLAPRYRGTEDQDPAPEPPRQAPEPQAGED